MKKITVLISLLAILAGYLWAQPLLAQAPIPRPTPDREAMDAGGSWDHRPQTEQPSSYALTLPLAPASAIAAWSKIAYQEYIGNWDVFSMGGDGSNPTRLTSSGGNEITPRLNRGATRVVYVSNEPGNYEIYAANPTGTGQVRLTNNPANDYNPAWSPNGAKIAFNSYRDGQSEIYVMNADGSGQTRLTTNPDYDGEPVWSPDGSKIAFVSIRDAGQQIYTMKPDGSNVTRITLSNASEFPCWSPDSSQLAFSADPDGDSWLELMVINADGTEVRTVADAGPNADLWTRSWSPDGRFIANTLIGFVNYQGNWYWTNAYLTGFDLAANQLAALGASDVSWYPDWQSTDVLPPTSSMTALPATSPSPIVVRWSGSDAGPSGILGYDVQVKDSESGTWTAWLTRTTTTSNNYPGIGGHTYYFRARAWDQSGNAEAWPASAETLTTVEALPPTSAVNPLPAYWRGDLTVSWGGSDPGGSGIATYDVQYRDGEGGTWTDWQMGTATTVATFGGTPGHTYGFRVRAVDRAQNAGAWSISSSTSTTWYAWRVFGNAVDSRGLSLVGVIAQTLPGNISSLPSNGGGAYAAYGAITTNEYLANWPNINFGTLPTTTLAFDRSGGARIDVALPPLDNVIGAPDFESDSWGNHWQPLGTPAPIVTTVLPHTGIYGALLGGNPSDFAPPVNLSALSGATHAVQLSSDQTGRLHLIWHQNDTIYYRWRDLNGHWSTIEDLAQHGVTVGTPKGVNTLIDDRGVVHAWWDNDASIYHVEREINGVWSNVEVVISGAAAIQTAQISVDSPGVVHLVFGRDWSYRVYYVSRALNGVWSSPMTISSLPGDEPQIAVDHCGQIHVVWELVYYGYYDVIYARRDPFGHWDSPVNLTPQDDGQHSQHPRLRVDELCAVHTLWTRGWPGPEWLAYSRRSPSGIWSDAIGAPSGQFGVDAQGTAHFIQGALGQILYQYRTAAGIWSDPQSVVAADYTAATIVVQPSGEVHLLWAQSVTYTIDILYSQLPMSSRLWTLPVNVSNSARLSTAPTLAIDQHGLPHAAWIDLASDTGTADMFYAGPPRATVDEDSSLRQELTVPLTLTKPTLSFMYQLGNPSPDGRAGFVVDVASGQSTTRSFSTTIVTDWKHGWIDLSEWQGQTVTVTFTVQHTADHFAPWVALDDVTIGSWTTPYMQVVTPYQIKAETTSVITIMGDNFLATPQVRIGDVTLPDATWINTNTITATVPLLPIGRYDVIITNPGGQASGLPGALLVGHEVLLPLIRK